jgi:dihydroorotase
MVHIGEAPPLIEDVLDLLGDGDVVTHCYHGKTGHPWRADGRPSPALDRALDRGVRLDVGHGAASFAADVARRAIAAGFPPHSISTDVHVRNIRGPVHDLPTTMTKLLACGMPLDDVITAVTDAPRETLRAPEPWLTEDGVVRHATVFRLTGAPPPHRGYEDARGIALDPAAHIVPVATVSDGTVTAAGQA